MICTKEWHTAAADYRHLLKMGVSSGVDTSFRSEEDEKRWYEQVANPWFEAIQQRAARDGLRVRTYQGWDNMGMGWVSPAAVFLRPDGSSYSDRLGWAGREELMRSDWGETLTRARKAQGLPAKTHHERLSFPRELGGMIGRLLLVMFRLRRV